MSIYDKNALQENKMKYDCPSCKANVSSIFEYLEITNNLTSYLHFNCHNCGEEWHFRIPYKDFRQTLYEYMYGKYRGKKWPNWMKVWRYADLNEKYKPYTKTKELAPKVNTGTTYAKFILYKLFG